AENDAGRALKGIGRTLLSANRLECSRTGAAGSGTFHLCNRAIRTSTIVDDAVADLIGLRVEMSTTLTRHVHHFVPLRFFSLEIGSDFLVPTLTEISVANSLFCQEERDKTKSPLCGLGRHGRYALPHIRPGTIPRL